MHSPEDESIIRSIGIGNALIGINRRVEPMVPSIIIPVPLSHQFNYTTSLMVCGVDADTIEKQEIEGGIKITGKGALQFFEKFPELCSALVEDNLKAMRALLLIEHLHTGPVENLPVFYRAGSEVLACVLPCSSANQTSISDTLQQGLGVTPETGDNCIRFIVPRDIWHFQKAFPNEIQFGKELTAIPEIVERGVGGENSIQLAIPCSSPEEQTTLYNALRYGSKERYGQEMQPHNGKIVGGQCCIRLSRREDIYKFIMCFPKETVWLKRYEEALKRQDRNPEEDMLSTYSHQSRVPQTTQQPIEKTNEIAIASQAKRPYVEPMDALIQTCNNWQKSEVIINTFFLPISEFPRETNQDAVVDLINKIGGRGSFCCIGAVMGKGVRAIEIDGKTFNKVIAPIQRVEQQEQAQTLEGHGLDLKEILKSLLRKRGL